MKKILTITAMLGVAAMTYGQGFVQTANTVNSKISAGGVVAAAGGGSNYMYEILVAPTTMTTIGATLAGWTDTLDTLTMSGSGRVIPGNNTPDNTGSAIPGYGSTATADFAVVAFSASLGSYANALAWWDNGLHDGNAQGASSIYFGISSVAEAVALAPSGGPYNNIWGPAASGEIQGMNMTLYSVPEPATFALAGLGATALVIFRRRK